MIDTELQRAYYAATAARYDSMHVAEGDEHFLALAFLAGVVEYLGAESILDIGSGTGRAVTFIKNRAPAVRVVGIEPVPELREVGHSKGLARTELIDGDATALAFADGEFDLVCEFGALHHIRDNDKAVDEMLRVARKAVFISDSNNFGQGSTAMRLLKQTIKAVGLWKVVDFFKTRGRGYIETEGDGVSYSYSVFNHYKRISVQCASVHVLNTSSAGVNPYRTAGHIALLGIKAH
jgi:ubiquinone/menaquinone biosynthesis C-methylase UbiE